METIKFIFSRSKTRSSSSPSSPPAVVAAANEWIADSYSGQLSLAAFGPLPF
jgi:hypothetical protein